MDLVYIVLLIALYGASAALIPAFARLIDRARERRK